MKATKYILLIHLMKTQLFVFLFLLISYCSLGQKEKGLIEINPYIRLDWYPQFSYAINSINTNFVNIKGTSWGINIAYKIHLPKKFYLKPGLGYYKYSFNKIGKENTSYGKSDKRHIGFPSSLLIPFFTDKYWYNTFSASIGIEKVFISKYDLQIITGINFSKYYTYSQIYHITYNNPDNPITNPYKLSNNRVFGFSTNLHAGIVKRIGKFNLGPSFIIPIFNTWKQDETFPEEDNANSRNKWLRGIGVGLSFNYSLLPKKQHL
jgi:hypothetical protein